LRTRPSARWLVLNQKNEILLFRFEHKAGALAGQCFWATPGGEVEDGETFEVAARRELFEETGLQAPGAIVEAGRRETVMRMPEGDYVLAKEVYFIMQVNKNAISTKGWSGEEAEVIAKWRWWSAADLAKTSDTVFPENITDLMPKA
jgi:ADP-ribose pyrophosphatase YjhB (NUDIX family)